jgi:sporulation protein YlmC with PRC-barrel domain
MIRNLTRAPLLGVSLVALLAAAPGVSAQEEAREGKTMVDITTWDSEQVYSGWSAEELLGEEVYGVNGYVAGEVEDFIVGADGRIQKVVVEGGGFLDMGDAHIAIPWDQIERVGSDALMAPVTEQNFAEYGLFEKVDDVPPKPSNFRLRELIGDYVTLQDGSGYGSVDDVIFSADDKISAVVVDPAFGYGYQRGPYALPYDASFDPYGANYSTPYTAVQLEQLAPFNYANLRSAEQSQRATANADRAEEPAARSTRPAMSGNAADEADRDANAGQASEENAMDQGEDQSQRPNRNEASTGDAAASEDVQADSPDIAEPAPAPAENVNTVYVRVPDEESVRIAGADYQAGDIRGDAIVTKDGESLGEIVRLVRRGDSPNDVIIRLDDENTRMAMQAGADNDAGEPEIAGGRTVALPASALKPEEGDDAFQLDLNAVTTARQVSYDNDSDSWTISTE